MTTLPKWKKHASGLETILVEKHDSPIAKFNIVFPLGSYEDPAGKEGITNFVGDMLLRGTKRKNRDQIEFALDHLGASFNIFSGYHSLMVEGRVLTKNFDAFLKLIKEILTEPSFDQAEVQKLKNEIKADLLLRLEDDQDLAKHQFFKQIYDKHLYSREVIGTPKSIDAFDPKDFQSIFEKSFSQKGMLFGAAGALTEEQFEKMAHDFYDLFPAGTDAPTRSPFQSTLNGKEVVLVDKPELTQTQFFIGHPCISATHPDLIALDIFMTAFAGSMFQAKYMQEIRVKRGWSYGAYGSLDARRDGGSAYLYTFPKNDDTVDAIALSIELLDQAVNGSLLDADAIQFTKNSMTRSYPFKIDTPEKILAQKIYNKLAGRPEDSLEKYRDKVAATDTDTIMKAAKTHLHPNDLKVVMVCTASHFEDSLAKRISPKSLTVKKYNELD